MRLIIMVLLLISLQATSQDTLKVKPDTVLMRIELDTLEETEPNPLSKLNPIKAKVNINGDIYEYLVTEDGDTIIIAKDISYVSITSMRSFSSDEEYRKYRKFRRYANKVYPYAKEAIRIFRELEYAETYLSKKERKKRVKELQAELKAEFEEPLSKLTKLQGKIMIKMIERELDETMYNLLKGVKGRFTAFYWHNFSKLYSYDLKEGYNVGKYIILDAVLQDFDISYEIENGTELKYLKIDKE